MPANVEIKAHLPDRAALIRSAAAQSRGPPTVLHQEDTFFRVADGRLKLRRLAPHLGELIFYRRPDAAGPKRSDYSISRTADPDGLAATLGQALGVLGVVRKVRTLYLVGQTRIHVDAVNGLGDFVELEVVLQPGQSTADAEAVARDLMARLGVRADDLVAGAYLDLLLSRPGGAS